MPLIVWDIKRALPVWGFMLSASVFLGFIFVENGAFGVYLDPAATFASRFIPPLLGLLVLVMVYSLISLRHFTIVKLDQDQFIFRNALGSVAIPTGENALMVFLDDKERIRRAMVLSPDGKILHQLGFRVMKLACTPEDVPSGYRVEAVMPGPSSTF